jgi:putative colanic acid biosynthesis UDP-glucose lipid carrier transferase
LNGEEILVYKFRSMTVCEDGAVVAQAVERDDRVTPLGAFLRRTSFDTSCHRSSTFSRAR